VGSLPDQIAELETRVAETADGPDRDELEDRLDYLRRYWEEQGDLVPTGPNTTLSERMTLFRGGREIRLLFFGRGHTGGDVVVHLPAERVLVSGDLLVPGLPYMGDGFLGEWIETLEHLKGLDVAWVLPGHGEPFQDLSRIDHLQAYMRDLDRQARALHAQGLTFEEAAERNDLTAHAGRYPQITGPGVAPITVQRIWELLAGG
jgi:glyoxylase-like metal-dependent hydrolase (beta-lactamase superfamily II)